MVFWRFWGWRCENIVFWPPKDTTLREYASVGVSHVKIGSTASALGPWKDFEYKEEEKLSGNFGYMGRSNPWADLDQMRLMMRYVGRNHVCNILWLSVKGCGCGERGKFAFSHWLDASLLQHWSHYLWPCDGRIFSHFGDIHRQRMAWPWNLGFGLFKVIENGEVRQTMCDFLLVSLCNYSSVLYHLRVIWRWIISRHWNLA